MALPPPRWGVTWRPVTVVLASVPVTCWSSDPFFGSLGSGVIEALEFPWLQSVTRSHAESCVTRVASESPPVNLPNDDTLPPLHSSELRLDSYQTPYGRQEAEPGTEGTTTTPERVRNHFPDRSWKGIPGIFTVRYLACTLNSKQHVDYKLESGNSSSNNSASI